MGFSAERDGVDHLNIYSKAITQLGRALSNFAHTPFDHPELGHFESVEGLWYWLSRQDESLRWLDGNEAKKHGKSLPLVMSYEDSEFKRLVTLGLLAKLESHPAIKRSLEETVLPLTHYYVYHFGGTEKMITPKDGEWILAVFEQVRRESSPQADCRNIRLLEAAAKQADLAPQMGLF
jgi:hypothetical protein